ncbi:hypothetical protein DSO57_1010346 [Entomophthora muscae]|uniref:Uncharacterized protein n=1 Tax=Entomophthora muscae TaxID=34485 RepID=A0ACC2UFD9_9FUNG|nr:hypothetical protein DSO57_1010346 [Entomophthora muscae]
MSYLRGRSQASKDVVEAFIRDIIQNTTDRPNLAAGVSLATILMDLKPSLSLNSLESPLAGWADTSQ